MKETHFTLPVCICPTALTVVVKLVTDAHCAEKSVNTRKFTFLENFHRSFTMKLIFKRSDENEYTKSGLQICDVTDRICTDNPCMIFREKSQVINFIRALTGFSTPNRGPRFLEDSNGNSISSGRSQEADFIRKVTGESQANDFDRKVIGAPKVKRTLTECSVLTEICQESSSNRGFTGAPEVKRTLTVFGFIRKVTEDEF